MKYYKIISWSFLFIFIFLFLLNSVKGDSKIEAGRWIHHFRQSPQSNILSIFSISGNKIWVSTDKAFHIFENSKWAKFPLRSEILGNNPPFTSDRSGNLYFIDNNFLKIWNQETSSLKTFPAEKLTFPVAGAFNAGYDTLLISSFSTSNGGIYIYDDSSVSKFKDCRAKSVTIDKKGRIWSTLIETDETLMKLKVFENGEWADMTENVNSLFRFASDTGLMVNVSPDGKIWVHNFGRYAIFDGSSWVLHPETTDASPSQLYFDSNGRVWGYGLSGGYSNLYLLDEKGTWNLSMSALYGMGNKPYFIASTDEGSLWTSDAEYLYKYTGKPESPWEKSDYSNDLASDRVTCMAYTEDGTLFCGHGVRGVNFNESEKAGISVYKNSSWHNYKGANGLRLDNIYDLLCINYDNILAYTDTGFKLFDGFEWSVIDSFFVSAQTSMVEDQSGNLWIGTEYYGESLGGLVKYEGDPYYKTYKPPFNVSQNHSFYNIFINGYGDVFMQNYFKSIITLRNGGKWELLVPEDYFVKDFIVTDDFDKIYAVRQNNLVLWQGTKGWENVKSEDTVQDIVLNTPSNFLRWGIDPKNYGFIDIDETGRIWASGYDNTGYLENGIWHRFNTLAGTASDKIVRYSDERVAFNAFDEEKSNFGGLFEYYGNITSVMEEKPQKIITARNYPNPFNTRTTIHFDCDIPQKLSIYIFNINGQKVKSYSEKMYNAGSNNLIWNGYTDSGLPAASGIYFYRIENMNKRYIGRMILLR